MAELNSSGKNNMAEKRQKKAIHHFLSVALRDFGHIGAIFPSTRWAARSVVRKLPKNCKTVVEYGAGNGIVSHHLLQALPADGKLFGIEVNPEFISDLRQWEDRRMDVIAGDVVAWSGRLKELAPNGVDAVVSGIPFSFLSYSQRRIVVANTCEALKPGGRFIVYQNTLQAKAPLKEVFGKIKVSFEPRNFFPYFIMVATR